MKKITVKKDEALVLRTCDSELKSYGGFQWPASGVVEAPDWDSLPNCGRGLHGLLWGCGSACLLSVYDSAVWVVCRVKTKDVVDLGDKVKFPRAEVVFTGSKRGAVDLIRRYAPSGSRVVYSFVEGGNGSILMAGDLSNLMAGRDSIIEAGNLSTLTAGNNSTLTSDVRSTLTAGYSSILKAGYSSILTADNGSVFKAGENSVFVTWWNTERVVAIVGKNGIKPDVAYKYGKNGWEEHHA